MLKLQFLNNYQTSFENVDSFGEQDSASFSIVQAISEFCFLTLKMGSK